jgi:hypothetical protein
MNMVRVGSGEGRTISLSNGSITVGDKYVFLPRATHDGGNVITYSRYLRALIVSTVSENGAGEYGAVGGTNAVPYYPIAIPEGKTTITVHTPGLVCVVGETYAGGSNGTAGSDWLAEGGGTYTFSGNHKHFILKFKKLDSSGAEVLFDANYDASGIYWDFT